MKDRSQLVLKILSISAMVLFLAPLLMLEAGKLTFETMPNFAFSNGLTKLGILSLIFMVMMILNVASQFINIKHKYIYSISFVGVSLIMLVMILLSFKSSLEIIQVDFLVKDLNWSFWLLFFVLFFMLEEAMKNAKVSFGYIILSILSIIWIFPIVFIFLTSLRGEAGFYSNVFIPHTFTFQNYIRLLTDNSVFYFGKWFLNTLFVASFTCILSTSIILSVSFSLSRLKFKGRKGMMNLFLILGMFPGFMSMIAVYYIIKALGLSQSLLALIVVYSAGSALGYYIVKGYFDTISQSLDDAAMVEGATKMQIFFQIILPLSKPIIIYTILTSFIAPWADFIFASVILGDNYPSYTVALGLYTMLENNYLDSWFTRFAAGAVLVSVPIAILFISLRKYYVEGLSSGAVKG